jgi:hypothetical protein
MAHHDRVPMPFARARSLLLGQLQRHKREGRGHPATLREALRASVDMCLPLWAGRVRVELARAKAVPRCDDHPPERQVTVLARSGHGQQRHHDRIVHKAHNRRSQSQPKLPRADIKTYAELGLLVSDTQLGSAGTDPGADRLLLQFLLPRFEAIPKRQMYNPANSAPGLSLRAGATPAKEGAL